MTALMDHALWFILGGSTLANAILWLRLREKTELLEIEKDHAANVFRTGRPRTTRTG